MYPYKESIHAIVGGKREKKKKNKIFSFKTNERAMSFYIYLHTGFLIIFFSFFFHNNAG